MNKLIFCATLVFVASTACKPKTEKKQVFVDPKMIHEPHTGIIDGGNYVIKTETIPADAHIASTTDAKRTVNAGISLVLKKIGKPAVGIAEWPGELAEDGFLRVGSADLSQLYTTYIGDNGEEMEISMELVSFSLIGEPVYSKRSKEPLVVRADSSGISKYFKLNDDLPQRYGTRIYYSETGRLGIRISGKLENGKRASQIVYIFGVIEVTPNEYKQLKYRF